MQHGTITSSVAFFKVSPFDALRIVYHFATIIDFVTDINERVTIARLGCGCPVDKLVENFW